MYYIYILRCNDNSLYTGITTDVIRRFNEHLADNKKGAKYTRKHIPIKIESIWETANKSLASKLEYYIKKLEKSKKENLILYENKFNEYLENKIDISEYRRIFRRQTNEKNK